jgi:UDP-N-acetylglucosamine:LPS N-acetylglucosamine transferase
VIKRIAFIICSNGYGHLKRNLAVISSLIDINPAIHIDVFCKPQLMQMVYTQINFKNDKHLNFHDNATSNEISWIKEEDITIPKYNEWSAELKNNDVLKKADIIISDNHVLPARVYPNVILVGSFLWHDVNLIWNKDTSLIAKEEHDFLKTYKPDMLCLDGMVMPEVLNCTNPIKLPWFCNKFYVNKIKSNTKSILITGGGTNLLDELLCRYTMELAILVPEIQIFIDSNLYKSKQLIFYKNIKKFTFSDEDFSSLTIVVCRPGIGILTDCVKYNIPVIVINDEYNNEIVNNAEKIEKIGIGISFSSKMPTYEMVYKTMMILNNPSLLCSFIHKISILPTGGAKLAAEYLLNRNI